MRPLRIDLRTTSEPPPLAWAALAIAVIAAAVALTTALHQYLASGSNRKQPEAAPAVPTAKEDVAARTPHYLPGAKQLLAEASSPWPDMLAVLEAEKTDAIIVTAVDISTASRSMRVEVRFADYADLLSFGKSLNRGSPVERWLIQSSEMGDGNEHMRGSATIVVRLD